MVIRTKCLVHNTVKADMGLDDTDKEWVNMRIDLNAAIAIRSDENENAVVHFTPDDYFVIQEPYEEISRLFEKIKTNGK